jgi:hypothetical protein
VGHTGLVAIDPDIAARAVERDAERAEALLAVLRSVDEGDLAADGPAAVAAVRRLEGAVMALAAMRESQP